MPIDSIMEAFCYIFIQFFVRKQLENVKLEIPMPKSVLNCTLTSTQGKYTFDPVAKSLSWDIGKIDTQKSPNIRGSVSKCHFIILVLSCREFHHRDKVILE